MRNLIPQEEKQGGFSPLTFYANSPKIVQIKCIVIYNDISMYTLDL